MRITWIIVGFILVILFGCTERMICPAYQSAFIHDERTLTAHFSYFEHDTIPKIREADKSRFLVIEPVAYNKRKREMRTVEMIDVYPVIDYAAIYEKKIEQLAEREEMDSAALATQAKDSIHPGLVGPFNTDQELYMYYLRDILILPDAREAMAEEAERVRREKKNKKKKKEAREDEKEEEEKKGPFSIFKKKDKDEKEEKDKEKNPDNNPPPAEKDPDNDEGQNEDDF